MLAAGASRGIDIYRFNSDEYPVRIGLRFSPLDPSDAVLIDGEREISLDVRGIWIRRPGWPTIDPAVSDPVDRRFALQESVAAMGGLWRALEPICVSPPDALQAARWKPAQIARAHRAVDLDVGEATCRP